MFAATPDITEDYEALIQFLYIAPVGLVQASLDGEIAMINPISAQLLLPLLPDADLTNLFSALKTVAPDLRDLVASYPRPYGMVCDAMRLHLTSKNGDRPGPQMLSLSILKLDQHRIMAVLNDITQQVLRERLLRQNEAWLDAVLTGVTDYALIRLDQNGGIDGWNASIGRVTGFDSEAVLGQAFSMFYPEGGMTADHVLDRLREADDSGWSLDDGWRIKADGTRFWGSGMISPLREPDANHPGHDTQPADPQEPAYCLVIRDITDKREEAEKQRQATSCDHQTGVANRRAFFEAAELELARNRRSPRELSLVIFETDPVVTAAGTPADPTTSAVLRHLASLLTSTFRAVDTVARLGPDEFAVLLPSTDLQRASAVAERLRLAVLARPLDGVGSSVPYTVTGGVATIGAEVTDLASLIQHAHSALDRARSGGRNRIECWSRHEQDAIA